MPQWLLADAGAILHILEAGRSVMWLVWVYLAPVGAAATSLGPLAVLQTTQSQQRGLHSGWHVLFNPCAALSAMC